MLEHHILYKPRTQWNRTPTSADNLLTNYIKVKAFHGQSSPAQPSPDQTRMEEILPINTHSI